MKTYMLSLALCALALPAAAADVVARPAPALAMRSIQTPQVLDPNIAALQASVKALQQENAALKAQLAKQDASIGQLLTQIIAVKGSINSLQGGVSGLQSDLGALTTKFDNHYHTYKSFGLSKTNLQVETPDSVSWATYINDSWWFDDKSSGPK